MTVEDDAGAPQPARDRWALPGAIPAWALILAAGAVGAGSAALTFALLQPAPVPPAVATRAEIAAVVRETLLASPEIIPEAITRLQDREVANLLASNREAIEAPFAGAWAGAADGDVVLVEFFDFNCPFCRQSAADVQRLLAEDKGLKVVWRDMPVLGPESERFALASLSAAQQNRYARFYGQVFGQSGRLSQERLIRDVRAAGLNEAQVARDLNSRELRAEVQRNLELARALGLTGTPLLCRGRPDPLRRGRL
jgi:protein-disulfide isomerase